MESNDKIVGHVGHKPLSIISDELDKLRERGIVIVDESNINEIKNQFEPEPILYSKQPYIPEILLASPYGKTQQEKDKTRINNIEESINNYLVLNNSTIEKEIILIKNKQSKLSKREREYILERYEI